MPTKKGERKSPSEPAKEAGVGATKKGEDGQMCVGTRR